MEDSLQILNDTLCANLNNVAPTSTHAHLWWYVIVLLMCLLFIGIIVIRKKTRNYRNTRAKVMAEGDINWNNTMNSMFQARAIYDELKVKYHPDRFLDPVQNEIATDLFQQITKNQHNYSKLVELKKLCLQQLGE